MYELIYSPTAVKQLEKLEHNIKERILVALERLRIRPESCDIKKIIAVSAAIFILGWAEIPCDGTPISQS